MGLERLELSILSASVSKTDVYPIPPQAHIRFSPILPPGEIGDTFEFGGKQRSRTPPVFLQDLVFKTSRSTITAALLSNVIELTDVNPLSQSPMLQFF